MPSAADYLVGPTIGEGSFGHVVYAVHKTTQRKVAIKVMEAPVMGATEHKHRQLWKEQKTAMILNERRILSLPELKSSKWIVNLWAAFCESNSRYLYFVMELATGGDLQGLIDRALTSSRAKSKRDAWRTDSVPFYASQLIEAIQFLHSTGILHCDLKPENVLLDAATGDLKLADFGCALDTNRQQQNRNPSSPPIMLPRGTARYSAPELLQAESPLALDAAVDYWSMGCILYAMFRGKSPFDRGSEALTIRAVFDYLDGAPSDLSPKQKWAEDTNDDESTRYPLYRLSQGLFAMIPGDRTTFWATSVIPLFDSKSQGESVGGDDAIHGIDNRRSATFATASNESGVLPSNPDWKDQVESATLRNGDLGWVAFQL